MSLKTDGYGDGRKEGRMKNSFMGPENGDHLPSGITVDGIIYALEGQPPAARSHGWGNVSWAYPPFGYRAGSLAGR
jgi:hypothetical protein